MQDVSKKVTQTIVKSDLGRKRPAHSPLSLPTVHQQSKPLATSSPKADKSLMAAKALTPPWTDQALSTSLAFCQTRANVPRSGNIDGEATLLETGELLHMIEQFAAVVASPRLKQELAEHTHAVGKLFSLILIQYYTIYYIFNQSILL